MGSDFDRAVSARVAVANDLAEKSSPDGRPLPRSRPKIVEDAGHFLISTHAPECAALLESFLRECESRRQPAMHH